MKTIKELGKLFNKALADGLRCGKFFAKERLIYECKGQSVDGLKEYHNAIFIGYNEDGVPRHAHKRELYIEGNAYIADKDYHDGYV